MARLSIPAVDEVVAGPPAFGVVLRGAAVQRKVQAMKVKSKVRAGDGAGLDPHGSPKP